MLTLREMFGLRTSGPEHVTVGPGPAAFGLQLITERVRKTEGIKAAMDVVTRHAQCSDNYEVMKALSQVQSEILDLMRAEEAAAWRLVND